MDSLQVSVLRGKMGLCNQLISTNENSPRSFQLVWLIFLLLTIANHNSKERIENVTSLKARLSPIFPSALSLRVLPNTRWEESF